MAVQKFRIALIGYGIGGAVFHAPLVAAVPGLLLSAIVTTNPERVAQAQRDFPSAKVLASAEEIFASPSSYDLVIVTSPNRYHFPQAKAALEAGLNVVMDKPMATNSAHCRELIDLAARQRKLLSVFQNRRLDGDFLTLKELIADGKLGKIVRFESRFERYRPQPKPGAWRELGSPEDGGGLLLDLGSHLIDQAINLFGRPTEVYCELDRRRPDVQTDDDCFVAITFASAVRAHLYASVLCRIKGHRFRLSGDMGTFEKYGMDPQEDDLRAGKRPRDAGWGADVEENWGTILTDWQGQTVSGKVPTVPGAYEDFYSGIYAALESGGDSSLLPVNAEDAFLTATIIEAATRSATEGTAVRL